MMQDAGYVVTYACSDNDHPHTQIIYLRGSMSPAAVEETLRVLGKTWCPACHRRQQQLDAEQYSHMFGLVPLKGADTDQLAYAEVIRARLLQVLITPQAKPKAVAALIALVNLCVEADFWIEHRMILWNRQRTGETLADMLACAFKACYEYAARGGLTPALSTQWRGSNRPYAAFYDGSQISINAPWHRHIYRKTVVLRFLALLNLLRFAPPGSCFLRACCVLCVL